MFPRSARLYDVIYSFKDYVREALRLHILIQQHGAPGRQVLDVGCGTGKHLAFLRYYKYTGEGLDLDRDLLAIARARYPAIPFHEGDMADFDLGHQVDVVTCLFSAIGYVRTEARLRQTLVTLARHVRPGGLVIVEPWFTPETVAAGGAFAPLFEETAGLAVARFTEHAVVDGCSVLTFHFLVQTPQGVESFAEEHVLGVFSHAQYLAAFESAGLAVQHDAEGLIGRGLYIGRQAAGQ